MALNLGTPIFSPSRCIDPHDKLSAIYQYFEEIGLPGPGDTYEVVYYDIVNNTIVNQDGDIISPGGATTIAVEDEGVVVGTYGTINFVGAGVTVTDGGTKATITIPGGAASFTAGDGIDISGGGEVSVDLATEKGLQFVTETADEKIAVWLVGAGGLEFRNEGDAEDGAIQDKHRYHFIKGQAKGAGYTPSTAGVTIDNVTSIHGETPVASSADEIVTHGWPMYLNDNDDVYAKYSDDGASGLADSFTTDTMGNLRPVMAGFPDFAPASNMLLGHDANGTTSSQQRMIWKTLENWLKLITGYSAGAEQYLKNDSGTIKWVTASEC